MSTTEAEVDVITRVLEKYSIPNSRRIAHKIHSALLLHQIGLLEREIDHG